MKLAKPYTHIFLLISGPLLVTHAFGGVESNDKSDHVTDYLETYRTGAAAGVASDEYNLGASYRWGIGLTQDPIVAAQWIRKAADQKYPIAERTMGEMCEAGEGVPVNNQDALEWYTRAAKHDDPLAQEAFNHLKAKLQK